MNGTNQSDVLNNMLYKNVRDADMQTYHASFNQEVRNLKQASIA